MSKFSAEELSVAHDVMHRVAAQIYAHPERVPDYVWTLPGDGYWGWAFSRTDTGPFKSLSRMMAAANEVTDRHTAKIERDARKKGRSASRKNPSPVRWLNFDREAQTADAMLARDPVVEREWYEEGNTFPIWNVLPVEWEARKAKSWQVYRHDDERYSETVGPLYTSFFLACRAVVKDAEKWLVDEPHRIMLRKHGLRP